jgi:UDP-2,4-diacetamido-2,4,6-trideoxy-beta-L-altropyranose hydrolase
MRALFRVDACASLGGGHAMRCLALADALADAGWACAIACGPETPVLVPGVARHHVLVLDGDGEARQSVGTRCPGEWDLAVVDHYGIDREFERSLRGYARRVLVIDDAPSRRHACDVLVDPTLDRPEDAYRSLVPEGCRLLLGPAHAPLRPEFRARRKESLERRAGEATFGRILVSFGFTDPLGLTARALEAMEIASWRGAVDVLLGAAAPHAREVRRAVARMGGRAALHGAEADVAALMARADLVIGAPGMSSWERCCLGAPTLLVGVAGNQRDNAHALVRHGAARFVGDAEAATAERIAGALEALVREPAALAEMGRAAAGVCDGRGTLRVTMALMSVPAARSGLEVSLGLAGADDCRTVYAWQSDERIRRYARNPRPPAWDEHRAWFAGALADPERFVCLILGGGKPAGMLRLDGVAPGTLEISVLVAPGLQGQGIGSAAIWLAHRMWPGQEMVAEVLPDNAASQTLFARAGFLQRTATTYARGPLSPRSHGEGCDNRGGRSVVAARRMEHNP